MYDFKTSTGIIFGATGFLGQLLAYKLSTLGCKLILHGKSVEKLKLLDNKINKIKIRQTLVQGDLNNENFYKNLFNSVSARFNQIDFIINLVGKYSRMSPITNFTHSEWSELVEININSHWRIIKELEPLIKKSQSPKLIFLNNKEISDGKPYHNILSISNAAIKVFANVYGSENKRLKIDTRLINLPNLESGITGATSHSKKKILIDDEIIEKIINESFFNKV